MYACIKELYDCALFIDDLFDGDINTEIFTYFMCSLTMCISFVCIARVLVKDLPWLEEKK